MSSSYEGKIRFTIFGQSHSPAIGVTAEGFPAGFAPDLNKLRDFLGRRSPGQNDLSTPRQEADLPEFLSGLKNGCFCGAPLTAVIRNTDTRSGDYLAIADTPRPGHADYTSAVKYNGYQDKDGGGHFSGRLTAPLCIVGGLCLQILEHRGIKVLARIAALGGISDSGTLNENSVIGAFPVLDPRQGAEMAEAIRQARADGDSLGGIIECAVFGVPAGLGSPMFDGMENRIARLVFGIPAVKGLEFGAGFAAAAMRGSQHNDTFRMDKGQVITETNHCGGILGGITDGMPIVFRAAIKPTPSIAKQQNTVNLKTGENTVISVPGRHDPCIVPRAVPCMEAAAAIAVLDALLEREGETWS